MRRYETIFIIDPDFSNEDQGQIFRKIKDLISQFDGVFVEIDEWGARKLAYEINKKNRGYYVSIDYCGNGALVNEMERSFRIDDNILKYMTILLEKNADPDAIKETREIEKEEAIAAQERSLHINESDEASDSLGEDKIEAEKNKEITIKNNEE